MFEILINFSFSLKRVRTLIIVNSEELYTSELRSVKNSGTLDLPHTQDILKGKGSNLGEFELYKNKIETKQNVIDLVQLTPSHQNIIQDHSI